MNAWSGALRSLRKPLPVAVAALLLIAAYVGYSLSAQAQRPPGERRTMVTAPDVSVIELRPAIY